MVQLGVSGLATLGLDLTDIMFLDSSGISVLVELRNQAQERGIDLVVLVRDQCLPGPLGVQGRVGEDVE